MDNETITVSEEQRRDLLFDVCRTKEELKKHIKVFLKVDLPDCTVDEDSNSNPMEFIWSVYETMLTGKGPQRVVVACARNSMKTLGIAILRFYSMIHFRRNGTHLSASLDQSNSLLMYLDRFLLIDDIRPYITVSNTRVKTMGNLPPNSFTRNNNCTLRVAVSTKVGVNSQRGSFNSRDESELIPREILRESAFISDPTQDEHRFGPIEVDLSSRKFADGIMQEKIDEAESLTPPKDLRLHKWSMVDFMKVCDTETHRPDLPKYDVLMNMETLETIWSNEGESVEVPNSTLYKKIKAFGGCKTCPAFIACQSRSVKQTGTSTALRDINFVNVILSSVKDPDMIIAQALNLRPGKTGNVFRMLRSYRHYLKPISFYEKCFGERFVPAGMTVDTAAKLFNVGDLRIVTPTKKDIYDKFVSDGWEITYGVDWGYSPARATCIVTAYHKRRRKAAIFHVESAQQLANVDWAGHIAKEIWSKYPGDFICPDMADPAAPTYFAKYKIRSLDTKPPRIETGVSQIRSLLFNPLTQESDFCILDDGSEDNKRMFDAMNHWTHRKTPLGFDFDKFEDDDNCDFNDPARYSLAPFIGDIKITTSMSNAKSFSDLPTQVALNDPDAKKQWEQKQELFSQMNDHFSREHGIGGIFGPQAEQKAQTKQKPKTTSGNNPIKFKF